MDSVQEIPSGYKKCTKCGAVLPATTEYFYFRPETGNLRLQCKECRREKGREWWNNNRTYCLEVKRQYREANRERRNAQAREYYRANRSRIAQVKRRWYEENRERRAETSRRWYEANREQHAAVARRYREAHADELREAARKWRANNPDKVKAKHRRRWIRAKGAEGKHTADDINLQYASQGGRCWWCGHVVGDVYDVDHRIPLSRGGTDDPENLVISCRSCNRKKGAKLPHEWNGRLL